MTDFILGSPPFTWTVTSRLISETATPSWSSTGFQTYLFEATISIPELSRSMSYSYYAPPHYVSQHRVSLDEDDHKFILASFFEDVINGDLEWAEFIAATGHAGDPKALDFCVIAKNVSFRARLIFKLPIFYFKNLLYELTEFDSEMPEFTDRDKSGFRDIEKED